MDLSNDESNFGHGKINETIPVNSHIREDFMIEDDEMYFSSFSDQIPSGCVLRRWTVGAVEHTTLNEDTLMQQEEDVIEAGHEGNKHQRFGIKDPIIVAVKAAPKGKRQRTCSKCHDPGHTQHTCPVYVDTKPCTTSLECSPVDPPKNDNINSRSTRDVRIRLQPYAYTECRIFFNLQLKEEYSEEVPKLEKNRRIVD
ncbi:hypothetical protein Cgig2_002089 [Carnegiea gigantea]|uniref:Protein FAR1-RELATED SEQUENCE n=1 Tax=Carnegiea gigantea TaxID=171969 RepID=A0A9Q1GQQ4_9CARY|nr:hypothetical protein Cgig2_002089 [Carnegiea gigantea]